MRLYHRLGHLKFKRMFSSYERELFRWLLTLKPGDIVGTCTGFNHVMAEVRVYRQFIGHRGGWFISSIRVTDTEGRWHWAPGGGCVSRPYSREEIIDFAREIQHNPYYQDDPFWASLLSAENTTTPYIDERGVYVGPPRR